MKLKSMSWNFDATKHVRITKEMMLNHLPSKTTMFIIVVTLGALLAPLPHFSLDCPDELQGGIIWPYPGETELELDYEVSSNSTIWWYDQYVEVNISLFVVADISAIGRVYNLTHVFLALNIDPVGRFLLMEETLNGTDGVFTNTSIYGTDEVFEYHRSYVITLNNLSGLKALGPKLHANLDFLLEVAWSGPGGTDMSTRLSNFQSGGTIDWYPKPFPIILDSPHYRISGILTYWSVLLSPILFYLIAVVWKRSQKLSVSFKRHSFWIITGFTGIYIAVMMAVTIGPFVPSAHFLPFSACVTLLIGLPIAFLTTGLRKIGEEPFPFLDQYAKYVDFCTLTGVKCRTRKELSESSLSWSPYRVPLINYDLATSRFLMFILFLESILTIGGSIVQPPTLILQQMGAVLLGYTLFVYVKGENVVTTINEAYGNWDLEWFYVWTLVHGQTVAEESVFSRLDLLQKLKDENDDYATDIELICRVLSASEDSLPSSQVQSRPESIKMALLTWYVRGHLKPQIEKSADETSQVLSTMLQPFEDVGLPWTHPLGSSKLLRRVIFVHDALLIHTREIVIDLADLVLDDDTSKTTADNTVRSQVSTIHSESFHNPRFPKLHTTSSVKSLLPFWSIFYLVIGALLSELLSAYI